MSWDAARRCLLVILLAGAVARLVLVLVAPGVPFDMESLRQVGDALGHSPLAVYAVNNDNAAPRWPYPGGFLPFVAVARWLGHAAGWRLTTAGRIPAALADLVIAALAFHVLRRMGASPRRCLAAAGLVALGPTLLLVSAVHGQIDAVAWLFAGSALLVWDRAMGDTDRRHQASLICGLLLGMAVAIKPPPGLMLLAVLPTTRGWRERFLVLAPVILIPLGATIPFALDAPAGLTGVLHYHGTVGRAGIATIAEPRLALFALSGGPFPSPALAWNTLANATVLVVGVPVALVFAWLCRRRVRALEAGPILVFLVLATAPAVLPQYAVWPFIVVVLAGRLRLAVAVQLAVLPLQVISYTYGSEPAIGGGPRLLPEALVRTIYMPYIAGLALAALTAAAACTLQARRRHDAPASRNLPLGGASPDVPVAAA